MSILLAMLLSSITARGVINPIVVAAPAGEDSALYFVLRNSTGNEDRLLGVACACAERVEIHNMVTRDGGRHMDVEPTVIMPPARLVEIRPGSSRHLMLLRLTRPLVAGETVPMGFLYADRTETVNVRVVADSRTGWTAGLAGSGPQRLAPMADLAGWCWRGAFPDGRAETRCFSAAYGSFMQERQVVEGGAAPATAYWMYAHDVMGMTTNYQSYGPDGTRRYGRLVPGAAGPTFEDYPPQPTREANVRTAWSRDGADAWIVRGEVRRGGSGWRESWRLRMVRAGPSPAL